MKVTIYGSNYTGHHFRLLECAYDSRDVKATLVGDESAIVDFILDNFSYGPDSAIQTINVLAEQMKKGSSDTLMMFDGCGAILAIYDENDKKIVNVYNKMVGVGIKFKTVKFIDLGTIQLPTTTDDLINKMVKAKVTNVA